MLDKHSIELINAGVDDELGPEERKELDDLLESSPEARELNSEMLLLSNFLDALPEQKPPSGLSHQILGQIKLPRKPVSFSLREAFASFQLLATGAAFAAGLLLTIGFYELAPRQVSSSELNKMVGTAVIDKRGLSSQPLGLLELKESWVSGSVTLEERQGLLVLNFDLNSVSPVEVELALMGAGLKFAGIVQEVNEPGRADEMVQVSGGTVRVENQGRQVFVIFLRNTAEKESGREINIEFSSGNQRAVKKFLRSS